MMKVLKTLAISAKGGNLMLGKVVFHQNWCSPVSTFQNCQLILGPRASLNSLVVEVDRLVGYRELFEHRRSYCLLVH